MPAQNRCVEPKIGTRIEEYIADMDVSSGEKKLTLEEISIVEGHLIQCSFCRRKLDLKLRLHLETMIILTGIFIDDPTLLEKRKQAAIHFFQDKISLEDFKTDMLNVSHEERRKLKALWKKDK